MINIIHPFKPWDENSLVYGVAIKNGQFFNRPAEKRLRDWTEIKFEYEYDDYYTLALFPAFETPREIGLFKFPLTKKDIQYIFYQSELRYYRKILKIK